MIRGVDGDALRAGAAFPDGAPIIPRGENTKSPIAHGASSYSLWRVTHCVRDTDRHPTQEIPWPLRRSLQKKRRRKPL